MTFNSFIIHLKKWLRPPRTLRVTKAGWKFLGLTLVVGFAAINTGNNLLYLVFGLMLSSITASGILSELMLRKVSIERSFPKHIFAQQPGLVRVTLTNNKRYISSFSLLVEDYTHQHPAEHARYVLTVPARQSIHVTYPMSFSRRGLHRPKRIRLSTRYPFGFFYKSASFVETDDEILVYPAIEKLQAADMSNLSRQSGEFESRKKGRGLEIHGIREYVPGDGTTRIHWKSTAKLAKLMTKEFEDDSQKKISLILDISLPVNRRTRSAAFIQDVERAISLTSSYLVHFMKSNFQIQLITPTYRSRFNHGQRHLFGLLRTLALLQPTNGQSRNRISASMRNLKRADVMSICISIHHVNGNKSGHFSKIVNIRS